MAVCVFAAVAGYAENEVIYTYTNSVKLGDEPTEYSLLVEMEQVDSGDRDKILKIANKYVNRIMRGEEGKTPLDYEQLVKTDSKKFFDDYREAYKEAKKNGDLCGPWSTECSFVIYQVNYEFVTIEYSGYELRGGAHGMPFMGGQTFRIDNGLAMDWDNMFQTKDNLRKCILEGYTEEGDEIDWDDVYEYTNSDEKTFPLPNSTPYITRDAGVCFQYQAYEIGPFVLGMPSVTVQFYDICSELDESLQQLMPDDEEEYEDEDELEGDIYPYDHPSQAEIYSTHELNDLASMQNAIYISDDDKEAFAGRYYSGAIAFLRDNWKEGSAEENNLAMSLLTTAPQVVKAAELYAYKKVRNIQIYEWGSVVYDYFPCKFVKHDDYIIFEKLGGSQRLWGEVYRCSDQSLAFTGCWYIGGGKPTGFSDEEKLITGLFKKVAGNKLLLVTKLENHYEIFEFAK